MISRTWKSIRLVAVALLALSAFAAGADAQQPGRKKDKSRTVSFEDDVIETTLLRPDVATTESINTKRRKSLIRIRTSFFAEIIRSAEDL